MRRLFIVLALVAGATSGAHAQYALFNATTDTISVSGNTVIGNEMTIEARLSLADPANVGAVFNEWQSGVEDKTLVFGGAQSPGGFAYPSGNTLLDSPSSLVADRFYHIAFVHDAANERIYLDGSLLASRPSASAAVSNGGGGSIAHVGAIFRDGFQRNSFVGAIDSLRVSSVARYAGASVVVPSGDMSTDANTELLYNFASTDYNSVNGTIADLSGNGHTGTFGTGFSGATSPRIAAAVPESSALALFPLSMLPLGLITLRRNSRKAL